MRGRVLLVGLLLACAPSLFGQSNRLNPTVRVLATPASPVPPECAEGLAPAVPRPVEIVEAPAPAIPAVPPRADLRTSLRRVQAAAESGDYESFKSALADARAMINNYPAGGEKQAANAALEVYSDLERLWDYSQTNATGAFFTKDSENGALFNALKRYPEFPRVVADSTMTIGGETIYPAHETRVFLTEQAAKRLSGLGVRTPARAAQETPRRAAPQPRTETRHPVTTERRQATKVTHAKTKASPKRAEAPAAAHAPAPAPVSKAPSSSVPAPVQTTAGNSGAPLTSAPAPVPAPVTTSSAAPAPITASTAATTTTETMSTAPPETAAPEETTASAEKPVPAAGGGMNLTFAIILIVVGIGVLILLFRASD